jgi:hypothetical protein
MEVAAPVKKAPVVAQSSYNFIDDEDDEPSSGTTGVIPTSMFD